MIKLFRLGQILLAAACGYVAGAGVHEITEPWLRKLEQRGYVTEDAVRYQPRPEPTEQERLDRIEEEITEDA